MLAADELPNDPVELKEIIVSIQTQYEQENTQLREYIRLLKQKMFGKKSEAISSEQLGLFNEAEELSEKAAEETEVTSYKRGKPKRNPIPDHLPREEVIIELPEAQRRCEEGHPLSEIGAESSEQIDIVPAQIKVIRTIRKKYACKTCEGEVKIAPVPPTAIPKSLAAPGLLALIVTNKYVDGLPLYRQEKILERSQIRIPRTTMASWMIKISELCQPVMNLMEEDLLASDYLQCDETRVQVLKEPGKRAESLSQMWVRSREGPEKIILFDYAPSRSGEVAEKLLAGFSGYLQVDGYGGYRKVSQREDIVRVGCWSHTRRKFYEAYQASKKGQGKAEQVLLLIKALYKIEEEAKDWSDEKRYQLRQEMSLPMLEKIRNFITDHRESVPSQCLLGKALNYAHNQWETLVVYVTDGRLKIDNNGVENKLRPFALGRKNWLFSDSVGGAKASATLYSLVETAKANGHNPYDYLRDLLTELPKAKTVEQIEKLLPYNLNPKQIASDWGQQVSIG